MPDYETHLIINRNHNIYNNLIKHTHINRTGV